MNTFILNMFVLWKVWNTLKYGWGNVSGWPEQHWLMVGTTLTDGWGSVGGWLGQRWLMVGATLAKVGQRWLMVGITLVLCMLLT